MLREHKLTKQQTSIIEFFLYTFFLRLSKYWLSTALVFDPSMFLIAIKFFSSFCIQFNAFLSFYLTFTGIINCVNVKIDFIVFHLRSWTELLTNFFYTSTQLLLHYKQLLCKLNFDFHVINQFISLHKKKCDANKCLKHTRRKFTSNSFVRCNAKKKCELVVITMNR